MSAAGSSSFDAFGFSTASSALPLSACAAFLSGAAGPGFSVSGLTCLFVSRACWILLVSMPIVAGACWPASAASLAFSSSSSAMTSFKACSTSGRSFGSMLLTSMPFSCNFWITSSSSTPSLSSSSCTSGGTVWLKAGTARHSRRRIRLRVLFIIPFISFPGMREATRSIGLLLVLLCIVFLIGAGGDVIKPVLIVEVPANSLSQPFAYLHGGFPT